MKFLLLSAIVLCALGNNVMKNSFAKGSGFTDGDNAVYNTIACFIGAPMALIGHELQPVSGQALILALLFGAAMAGDAIDHATAALLDEAVDFFPEAKRLAFKKILSATRRFGGIAKKKLETMLQDGKFEGKLVSEMERLTGLSGNAPVSAKESARDESTRQYSAGHLVREERR